VQLGVEVEPEEESKYGRSHIDVLQSVNSGEDAGVDEVNSNKPVEYYKEDYTEEYNTEHKEDIKKEGSVGQTEEQGDTKSKVYDTAEEHKEAEDDEPIQANNDFTNIKKSNAKDMEELKILQQEDNY
jgi:hypothetical protein